MKIILFLLIFISFDTLAKNDYAWYFNLKDKEYGCSVKVFFGRVPIPTNKENCLRHQTYITYEHDGDSMFCILKDKVTKEEVLRSPCKELNEKMGEKFNIKILKSKLVERNNKYQTYFKVENGESFYLANSRLKISDETKLKKYYDDCEQKKEGNSSLKYITDVIKKLHFDIQEKVKAATLVLKKRGLYREGQTQWQLEEFYKFNCSNKNKTIVRLKSGNEIFCSKKEDGSFEEYFRIPLTGKSKGNDSFFSLKKSDINAELIWIDLNDDGKILPEKKELIQSIDNVEAVSSKAIILKFDDIHEINPGKFPKNVSKEKVAKNIIRLVNDYHEKKLILGEIKPSSLLMNQNGDVIVKDFYFVNSVDYKKLKDKTIIPTDIYSDDRIEINFDPNYISTIPKFSLTDPLPKSANDFIRNENWSTCLTVLQILSSGVAISKLYVSSDKSPRLQKVELTDQDIQIVVNEYVKDNNLNSFLKKCLRADSQQIPLKLDVNF